jgi:hypothetical protein
MLEEFAALKRRRFGKKASFPDARPAEKWAGWPQGLYRPFCGTQSDGAVDRENGRRVGSRLRQHFEIGTQAALKTFVPSASSALNSSSDSVKFTAATFSSRCLTFDVPGIGSITGLRFNTQSSATWLGAAL